jgi:lipoprotein signal peptidase
VTGGSGADPRAGPGTDPGAAPATGAAPAAEGAFLWRWGLFVLIAVAGLAFDLWSKAAAFERLGWPNERLEPLPSACPDHPTTRGYEIIPCVFEFHTSVNSGGIWGNFDGSGTALAAFSIVAMAVVIYWLLITPHEQWIRRCALGLLFAGAAGNFYDRVFVRPDVLDLQGGRYVGRLREEAPDTLEFAGGVRVPVANLHALNRVDRDSWEIIRTDGTRTTARSPSGFPVPVLIIHPDYDDPAAVDVIPLDDVLRIRRKLGSVRDFLHVHYKDVWDYPIFNIADSCLVVGVTILLIAGLGDTREDLTALRRWLSQRFGPAAAPSGADKTGADKTGADSTDRGGSRKRKR